MFKFDKSDVQRIAVAAVGALILSTAMVASAVGPARAIETARIAHVEAPSAAPANA